MGRSVYTLTAAQYAGEQTTAGVDARKVTERELGKEWRRDTVRHLKHYNDMCDFLIINMYKA